MYHIGERVIYGIHGVCCVIDWEGRIVDGKKVTYLVLEPLGQSSSRYMIPTHNAAAMGKVRSILSCEELEDLLQSEIIYKDGWIRDESQRKLTYRELINSGDRARQLQMVRTLYIHRAAQAAAGKKCHMCDENFLRDAEKLLASEISIVLNMDLETAKKFLQEKLKEDA